MGVPASALWFAVLPLFLGSLPSRGHAQIPAIVIELEGGSAWQSRNEVQIPNNETADRFSLADLAGSGAWPAARVYVTWNVSDRHGIRLLLAPFSLTETGLVDASLRFAGATYDEATPVTATYTFNSYRLSYRWRFHDASRTTAWLGLTAKIRDATVRLEQESTRSRKDDLGFVPLLHLAADWRPTERWTLSLDGDGLAGGPGRAFDASLKLGLELDRDWRLSVGYRTVEGGADVEEVYNFAWLHYAVVSATWRP
ncbi:MAG: hypothetical protein HKO77_09155 [Gemmatimonadetes bacterium]|nr:hypothetical protein [Gemmatimonadota bacterium]NNM32957.1 hypothetical protein [Gemmatimonadota bacterium]